MPSRRSLTATISPEYRAKRKERLAKLHGHRATLTELWQEHNRIAKALADTLSILEDEIMELELGKK